MNKIRVLVVDDHPTVREGACLIISREPDCEVCGAVATGREALNETAKCLPDVVVLDLHLPDVGGVTVAREIKKLHPKVELVMFTAEESEAAVTESFQAGVKSFIRKTDLVELLVTAIRAAAEHRPFFTPEIGEILFGRMFGKPSRAQLTPREHEITRLLANGKSSKEMAAALGISTRTVEVHRAAVMRKLNLSSTAEIVRYALRNGIIER